MAAKKREDALRERDEQWLAKLRGYSLYPSVEDIHRALLSEEEG